MLESASPEPSSGGSWNLQTHGSGLIEQALEYQFLAALTPELLRRGMRFEVLRGDFDLDGHDVVIETDGIMRHIQLKGMAEGGKSRRVPINTRLGAKPSGCVVWMTYDPETLAITGWRWFGGAPGAVLPHLGDRVAKHSKANKDGIKAERPHIRILPDSQFARVGDIAALTDFLFGTAEHAMLRRHLRDRAEPAQGWQAQVQVGNFAAIPARLGWDASVELAHLIDGYALVGHLGLGEPTAYAQRQLEAAERDGFWSGNAAELWISLFLEHRRWRMSSPHEPGPDMAALLDLLVIQLRQALTGEQV